MLVDGYCRHFSRIGLAVCFDRVCKGAGSRILKNGERAISVGDWILIFGTEIAQRNQRAFEYCFSPLMTTVKKLFNEF